MLHLQRDDYTQGCCRLICSNWQTYCTLSAGQVVRKLEMALILNWRPFPGFRDAFDAAEIRWDLDPYPYEQQLLSIEQGEHSCCAPLYCLCYLHPLTKADKSEIHGEMMDLRARTAEGTMITFLVDCQYHASNVKDFVRCSFSYCLTWVRRLIEWVHSYKIVNCQNDTRILTGI